MSTTHAPSQEQNASECCKGGPKNGPGCCGGAAKDPVLTANLTTPMNAEQLEKLPTAHLVMRYRRGIEAFDRRVFQLTEEQIDQAFLPDANVGRWPVRVLIGHVADAEVAAVHRMRRIVGEESPTVSLWDEDAFVDANLYQNAPKQYAPTPEADHARVMHALGGSMAVIHTLRQWTGNWLMSLDESAWGRAMMHPQRGPVALRQYLAMNVWHLEHHAAFLKKKLDRMGIVAEPEEECSSGSCGCRG